MARPATPPRLSRRRAWCGALVALVAATMLVGCTAGLSPALAQMLGPRRGALSVRRRDGASGSEQQGRCARERGVDVQHGSGFCVEEPGSSRD